MKYGLHVAYKNIRTLQDVGVHSLITQELRKHNVDTACLSEVRIPESSHSVIKVLGEEAFYHSGVADITGRHGVAIAFSEAAQPALLAWESISLRRASAWLKGTTMNLIVVSLCHKAPRN